MARDPSCSHPFARLLALLLLALCCATGPALAAEKPPLAIRGYDPVAYFTLKETDKAVPGKSRFEYQWDEQRYRFATAANLAAFRKEPGRYLPRFGNLCASALAYGLDFEADPNNWIVHDGRLYLFGTAGARDVFAADPNTMISAAERNAERVRKGQQPVPELPLPEQMRAGVKDHLSRCKADPRTPNCEPQVLARLQSVIDNQPPDMRRVLPRQPAGQP